jgi:hypothetical protein
MKIIGKQYDYYDSARCYSFCSDSEAVFLRKEEEKQIKMKERIDFNFPLEATKLMVIGFCGEIYPVIRVMTNESEYERKSHFFYDVDSYFNFISKKKNQKKIYFSNQWRADRFSWKKYVKNFDEANRVNYKYGFSYRVFSKYRKVSNRQEAVDAFELLKNNQEIKDLFLEHKCPYFILKDGTDDRVITSHRGVVMVINPILKNYEFFKIMDPRIAYQEIEMFFNSVLVGEANPPQIKDDVILAEKKGFDKRISFRHRK